MFPSRGTGSQRGTGRVFREGEPAFGQGAGAAVVRLSPRAGAALFGSRKPRRSAAVLDWLAGTDLTTDLGQNIGSGQWYRGLVTCLLLCAMPLALWPQARPLPVHVDRPLIGDAQDEWRSQVIAPQAFGSDTGRRMAATDAVQTLTDTPERPSIDLTASLGQGDSLRRVLERSGVGAAEAAQVIALVASAADVSTIKPATPIKITLGRRASRATARPLDFLALRARIDLGLAVRREGGRLVLERMPVAVDRTPLRIEGRVGDSLYRSARAAGVPARAIEAYLRVVAAKVSLGSDVNADARFEMVVERVRAVTGETEYGKLLFAGLYRGKDKLQMIEWTVNGRTEWFDAGGVGKTRAGMVRPVQYARVSSGFGMRIHPLLRYSRFHRGMDYAAAHGTPIMAVTDGVVAFAGRSGGYGNFVRLSHAGGMGSGYGHMSRIAVGAGQRVAAGQVIGYVGSTGLSTGPHLHFEVYRNGRAVNPAGVTFASSSLLNGDELARFRARLSSVLASARPGSGSPATASAR